MFLQEAAEHLQTLREYVGVLQDFEPRREDVERLYISAHTLSGTSASYGYPRFSEVAAKLAHVFQYASQRFSRQRFARPANRISVRRHLACSKPTCSKSATPATKPSTTLPPSKTAIASPFPVEGARFAIPESRSANPNQQSRILKSRNPDAAVTGSYFDSLPTDDEVPDEILEFFQPEAEEHLQIVSDCLISLEGSNNPEEINKLFRAIHTVKGSAAQVGLKRLGAIAHRVEDLIGRLRDGELDPSPSVIDVCLESVDILKKTLHRQFLDDTEMRAVVDSLLGSHRGIRARRR